MADVTDISFTINSTPGLRRTIIAAKVALDAAAK